MTKTEKLYNLLASGDEFTTAQLIKKTGLKSPSAAIRDLRSEGARIFLNTRKTSKGLVSKYRMAS